MRADTRRRRRLAAAKLGRYGADTYVEVRSRTAVREHLLGPPIDSPPVGVDLRDVEGLEQRGQLFEIEAVAFVGGDSSIG
jgi:hypothetical protein